MRYQRFCGFLSLGRIEPGIQPDHFDGDIRIGVLRPKCEGVDHADNFGNGISGHHAQRVGFADKARSHAGDIGAFIIAGLKITEIFSRSVAAGMNETDVRLLGRQLQSVIHIAE